MNTLLESVDAFGMPINEIKKPNFEKGLWELVDAVEKHIALKGGEEDPLPAALEKSKELLMPEEISQEEAPEKNPMAVGEETIDEMATARSTIKKYEALKEKKFWDKQEILSVAHRLSDLKRGWKQDMDEELKYILHELLAMFEEGKTVDISPEQTQQGIDWLKKNVVDANGKLRNNKVAKQFTQEHADIIHNFKKFELVGFEELDYGYAPVYRTIDKSGNHFDYSVYGMGEINVK